VAICVDHKGLAMAQKDWSRFRALLRVYSVAFHTLSFQQVLSLAAQAAPQDPIGPQLTAWAECKISQV